MDRLTGFLTEGGHFRIVMAETADISNNLKKIHYLSYPVMNAMSRFLTGAVLLSSNLKGKDVVGVYLNCSGPLAGMRVEANATGQLKALALQPQAGVDEIDSSYVRPLGQLIGEGTLTVSKIMEVGRTPFTGTVQVEGDRLAIGFSRYLRDSEQTQSAVLISNFLTPEGHAKASAGILVQALPGSEDELAAIEKEIQGFPPFSDVIMEVDNADQAVQMLFPRYKPSRLFQRPLEFHCSCSRGKVIRVLSSLSPGDREDARQSDGLFHVNCDYCRTEYIIRPEELSQ